MYPFYSQHLPTDPQVKKLHKCIVQKLHTRIKNSFDEEVFIEIMNFFKTNFKVMTWMNVMRFYWCIYVQLIACE